MKYLLLLSGILLNAHQCAAQLGNTYSGDINSANTAAVHPHANSDSSSATAAINVTGEEDGLSPSLAKRDVHFSVVDSSLFDIDGIDFSIDYKRDKDTAQFFTRGSSLIISAGANFSVSYRVDNGAGGFATVSSGNVYSIPNDDIFRTYRFYYLPNSGEGFLIVDGEQVWANDGPDNRNMYWTGAGNVSIGTSVVDSGTNKIYRRNMVIKAIHNTPLPVQLTKFSVKPVDNAALIEWQTASESNNDYFEVEKSANGNEWQSITTVKGANNSSKTIDYNYLDTQPLSGISYYRLKQIDLGGQLKVFAPVVVNFDLTLSSLTKLTVFPNPADNRITVGLSYLSNNEIRVFSAQGKHMQTIINSNYDQISLDIDITDFPAGAYIISDGQSTVRFIKK